ncbi:DUF624 domain-containing protein [Piscibacillus salipiscarius]|uniref:DUF624 domain-containing protein n=1 Tax=Piscibacillus salipiscarius TaxID=299480 RepID=UPI0006D0601B|nr:DUF624 domain-containing protein [Piscibacillus salipiscarius]
MKQFIQSIYQLTNWIMSLVYMNLLWAVFTLLGGVVLGILPSTVTLYAISKKWIQGDYNFKLHQEFWKHYKYVFLTSNKLILIVLPLILIAFINLLFIVEQGAFQLVHLPFGESLS